MPGRYTLTATGPEIVAHFGAIPRFEGFERFAPRYNIAPMQILPIVRKGDRGAEVVSAHWGLIPFWAKDRAIAAHMINARSDSVTIKPAFRLAFKRRRCLVPADGFFGWKEVGGVARGSKQPYRFTLKEGGLFAFAGLWERWSSPDGVAIESYAIITTDANATVRTVDDRMPIIVPPAHYARWLGIDRDPAYALTLVEPVPDTLLRATPVSVAVNNAAHDAPDCIAPIELPARMP